MTNMENEWKNWASIIRSCIITSKTPLTPYKINRDVRKLEGKYIPYRTFKFQNLEEMLRKIPGLQVFQENGMTGVKVLPTENTAHIARMVALQQSKPKKPRNPYNRHNPGFNPERRTHPNNRPQPTNNRMNVPNLSSIQNRLNASNNSYTRSFSTEPQRRPTPSPTAYTIPARSNSYDYATRTSPTPLRRNPITPPPTPRMQKLITPPMTSPHQKPQQPTPPVPKTSIHVGAKNQSILSPLSRKANDKRPSSPRAHSPPLNQEPEVLQLKNMDEFWLHVYVVYGTTDIWGVIIDEDHSDKKDELAQEMKTWYDVHNSPVPTIVPGKYYAVLDSEWYHRVRCIKVDPESQQATVFFIDRGDEDVFPVTRLRSLQPEFCVLPAQSVLLSLTGLEDFALYEEIQALLEEMLVDKTVLVKNMKFERMYNEERYVNPVSAQLYLEDEMNVNDEVMRILDPNSKIGMENTAQQAFISNVSEKAIFVQLKSTGLDLLNDLMGKLTKDCLNKSHFKLKPVSRFDLTKIYITENPEDKKWYRVKVTIIINENEAQVMCIDVGTTIQVNRGKLVLLKELSNLLTLYPRQAIQVQLHKISPIVFDIKMAQHLRKLAPKSDLFYMKVVGMYEQVPIVEFYKRTENNYLASLNDTLALEPEIQSKDDEYNNNMKPRIRNVRSSIGARSELSLKAPSIPPVDSYFDVHITMAAHPGNFTIQPLLDLPKLEKLMVELSKVCNSYNGPPLTPSSVKVGNMYAAKYDDGRWYRAYVSKVISKNVCAVYFCDYGDYRPVTLDLLQPLQNQFYDLPYLAIKAKLHGITPKLEGDWSVEDTLRFDKLIVSKNLVSTIKSCDMDKLLSRDIVLSLELIDTTDPTKDIHILQMFLSTKTEQTE